MRRICRELVLDVVLRRALQAEQSQDPGRVQLIVDEATLTVLNSFLRMGDLLNADGITSMELVERGREPLPELDALYLVRPEASNIELILGDFKSANKPQHRAVHLAFTSPLVVELLSRLAEGPHLAPRVRSLVEVPLSFVMIQDRGFHFDLPAALPGLFPSPDPLLLEVVAHRLADICRCLQATTPCIRRGQSEVCKAVAERVQQELAGSRNPSQGGQVSCQLLIVDRSVDIAATLVHEFTYEAMMYDLLDGEIIDVSRNIVRMPRTGNQSAAGGERVREFLLSDADPLWEELKHMHLEDVQHAVDLKREETIKNSMARNGKNDLLKELHDAHEQSQARDRLKLHIDLVAELFRRLQEERLMTGLGMLEQDIACGVDQYGKDVKASHLQVQLTKVFSELETTLGSQAKLRMLMLYLACMANVQDTVRSKLIEMARLTPEDQAVLMAMLRTRLIEVPEAQRHKLGSGTVHRVTKDQATRLKRNARTEGHRVLSRFEPRVKALFEQLLEKTLSEEDFPTIQVGTWSGAGAGTGTHGLRLVGTMGCAPPGAPATVPQNDWTFSTWPGAANPAGAAGGEGAGGEVSHRVIIFVVGGITLSEIRVAAEMAQSLPRGTEVVLGGTSVLTPRRMVQLLRPAGVSPFAEDNHGAEGTGLQDELDLT